MLIRFPFAEIDTHVFTGGYFSGRQQWLTHLRQLPYPIQHNAYLCDGVGPDGEELATDSVWLGDPDADRVVVILAGTHGIEGLAGSAIQSDLLGLLASRRLSIPDQTALLVVHALTPWGFAWLRRCDAEGIDLNRNAIDFSQPVPENPGYDVLRPAMFCDDAVQRQRVFDEFARAHGRKALEIAISGGQYSDPEGPFFGGHAPAHGRLVCEALISEFNLNLRQLAVIDLHTGLGPYSYGELICDHDPNSAGAAMAKQWYGDSVTLPLAGTSSSVPKLGLLDYLWHGVMEEHSCYVTLEFGTYSTDALFEVLLKDHQVWAQADLNDAKLVHSQLMRQHFCPNDQAWQEMVLLRARQVVAQAIQGVSC
ncbi:MAG: DUF2817 domain-containing protein [Gammaproteobacteria bacterium]